MRVLWVKTEKNGTMNCGVEWSDSGTDTVMFAPWINANEALEYLLARDNERIQAAAAGATRQLSFEGLCEKQST
jgi:hypothetical protein